MGPYASSAMGDSDAALKRRVAAMETALGGLSAELAAAIAATSAACGARHAPSRGDPARMNLIQSFTILLPVHLLALLAVHVYHSAAMK